MDELEIYDSDGNLLSIEDLPVGTIVEGPEGDELVVVAYNGQFIEGQDSAEQSGKQDERDQARAISREKRQARRERREKRNARYQQYEQEHQAAVDRLSKQAPQQEQQPSQLEYVTRVEAAAAEKDREKVRERLLNKHREKVRERLLDKHRERQQKADSSPPPGE